MEEKPLRIEPMLAWAQDFNKAVHDDVMANLEAIYKTGKPLPIPEKTDEQKIQARLKYAWVNRAGKKVMVFLDNETMEPYMMDKYDGSCRVDLIKPLTKDAEKIEFIRWCTLMDMG